MVTGPSLGGIVGAALTLTGFGGAQAPRPASLAAPDPACAARRDSDGVIVVSSSFLVIESAASVARRSRNPTTHSAGTFTVRGSCSIRRYRSSIEGSPT